MFWNALSIGGISAPVLRKNGKSTWRKFAKCYRTRRTFSLEVDTSLAKLGQAHAKLGQAQISGKEHNMDRLIVRHSWAAIYSVFLESRQLTPGLIYLIYRKGARMKAKREAFIRLPSGKLCVDSANTWPFGPEVASDRGQGAVLDVPPGDYVAAIHWLSGSGYDGPAQFISLSPVAAEAPLPRASGILEPT